MIFFTYLGRGIVSSGVHFHLAEARFWAMYIELLKRQPLEAFHKVHLCRAIGSVYSMSRTAAKHATSAMSWSFYHGKSVQQCEDRHAAQVFHN